MYFGSSSMNTSAATASSAASAVVVASAVVARNSSESFAYFPCHVWIKESSKSDNISWDETMIV